MFGGFTGVLALGLLYVLVFVNHGGQYLPISLILGFLVLSTGYFIVEDTRTGGTFDEQGISFRTPWSGQKTRQWHELRELRFNGAMGWYVLKFTDGSKIRVSRLLMGHARLLEVLAARGFEPKS